MEDPVHAVLVIRGSKNLGNDKLPASCDDRGIVAEVCVFEEDARVFLVDTDSVFNCYGGTGFIGEDCVEVVNYAFAIAAQTSPTGQNSDQMEKAGRAYARELVMYPPPYSPRSNACFL